MMTIEELEKRQDELAAMWGELQVEINALKKAQAEDAKPLPPHPRWKPKNGESYFYITTRGYLSNEKWFDTDPYLDTYKFGNLFLSAEAANFAAERLKVLAEMREWAGKWDDEYSLRYDEDNGIEAFFQVSYQKSYGEMRFATKKDAENCIEAVGKDRIKKYYFMVPEGDKDV